MGYYKNSWKSSKGFESSELTNLKGWVVFGGIIITSLFFSSLLITTDNAASNIMPVWAIFIVAALISFICDTFLIVRVLFALIIIAAIGLISWVCILDFSISNMIFTILGIFYSLGILWNLWKLQQSIQGNNEQ